MGEKDQHLCKLKDELKEDFNRYVRLIKDPRFVCLKCGRAANEEKRLCKPVSLES